MSIPVHSSQAILHRDLQIDSFLKRIQGSQEFFASSQEDHLGHLEQHLNADFKELRRQLLQDAAQQKADQCPNLCPVCQQRLKRCRPRSRTFPTGAGDIKIDRASGWCKKCQAWFCPADHLLGLEAGSSPYVQEAAALLASKMPEAEAAQVLQQLTGIELAEATLKRTVHKTSQQATGLRDQLDEKAGSGIGLPPPDPRKTPVTMCIQIDAFNIRGRDHWGESEEMRKAGKDFTRWHWVWTGTVFTLDQRTKAGERPIIVERGYVATRQGIDGLRGQLHAEAMRHGLTQAPRVVIVADGAVWIWNLSKDRFPQAVERLDIFHALGHLREAAGLLYEDPEEANRWREKMEKLLKEGECPQVIGSMEEVLEHLDPGRKPVVQDRLNREVAYFKEHQDRMDYGDATARNEPLGSGAIESTCRQYQCRFKMTGQYWSDEGVEGLFSIQNFWRNDRWNQLFPRSSRCNPSLN